ncbi:MAG: hypothetical protein L0H26_13235, partial [Microlunatus sp.]|nr:hypothetical protein [Microlunatus sp.]
VGLVQGSLIFVVIVAVWAVYLVQHWVRRREDAAATRSVEGFSEAMRVLQKRPFLRGKGMAEPRPDSYAVTSARSSQAPIDVKRAQPVGAARAGSPLTARSNRSNRGVTAEVTATDTSITRITASTVSTQSDPVKVEPMPQTRRPNSAPDDRRRPTAPAVGPSMGQRRLRAALLLAALAWVPTSIVLAATTELTWHSVPFAVLTVAAVVFWLRTEAAADRAKRVAARDDHGAAASAPFEAADDDTQAVHTHAYAAGSGAAGRVTAQGSRASVDTTAADTIAASAESAGSATAGSQPDVQTPPAPREIASFFDGEAATAAATQGRGTAATPVAPAEPLAPGTWSPVPVPRPTYSLKAKAEPRLTESGIPADVFATPEFEDEADELDDRARLARRAVSG